MSTNEARVEAPEQSYYVSCKVRLAIRFDEYALDTLRKQIAPGTTESKNIKGPPAPRSSLRVIEDPEAPAGIKRFEIASGSGSSTVSQEGSGTTRIASPDEFTFRVSGIIPHACSLERNSFRKADTAKIELRFVDLPFDPRVMRSIAVDVFMGTVSAEEFAAGVNGATRAAASGQGTEPLNVLADTWLDANGNQRSNLRFEGWVDAYEMSWTKDGEQLVALECRDSTHLLTLIDAPKASSVDTKKPIDEAVADYLAQFPMMQGLQVEYRPAGNRDGDTPPRLNKVLTGTSFQPHLGPPVSKGGAATGGDNLNIWDYLTDVVGAVGHTIRVEGRLIIIQRIRDALDGQIGRRPGDPYVSRKLASRQYDNRTMIYGRNVKNLKVRKEFTKKVPTNIEVRCYNPRRKKVLAARFPEKADAQQVIARPGADTNDKKWSVIPVSGIEDEKTLKIIAEEAYNQLGRNEVLVEIETDDLGSFGGGNDDPDLLDVVCGDTIELLVNHDEDFNTQTEIATKSSVFDRNVELMQHLGYDVDTAKGYAKAYTDANFQRIFRVKEVKVDWSTEADGGIGIHLALANYIEARADKPSDKGATAASNSQLAQNDKARKDAAAVAKLNNQLANLNSALKLPGGTVIINKK